MVKNIVKDINFLKQKSQVASIDDLYIVKDLEDTLSFHVNDCVGLAANMIGYSKTILSMRLDNRSILTMINPTIIKHPDSYYKTSEGCLSLIGKRECIRYKSIKVMYFDKSFKKIIKTFYDFEAEIIQHEMDHFEGIII